MASDFSRTLALLRREKKISQRMAANDLGVSQALLSHYENGLREPGLSFVVRAADYYGVSCDYLLGRSMAREAGRVIGVESVPSAIESARRAAKKMGVADAAFFCADAGTAAAQLAQDGLRPSLILLDPPRKGCDLRTIDAVAEMSPSRVVMVSCNPATAARDAKLLAQRGYLPRRLQPVDLFPRTKHVESVTLFTRADCASAGQGH